MMKSAKSLFELECLRRRSAYLLLGRVHTNLSAAQWPALAPLIGGPVKTKLIQQQLSEVLRLTESIQQGTVTASLILRKLGSYPRQNSLALALREVGRERTLFMLEWLKESSPAPARLRRSQQGRGQEFTRSGCVRRRLLRADETAGG